MSGASQLDARDELDRDAPRIGGALFLLLADRAWIRRRSETVTLGDFETLRLESTLDIVLPTDSYDRLERDRPLARRSPRKRRVVVPLDKLAKGPLVQFDLTLDGRSASLLNSREIAVFTAWMLAHVANDAREPAAGVEVFELLKLVGDVHRETSREAIKRLETTLAGSSPTLLREARNYVDDYLLLAEITTESRQFIIKYARDRPLGTTLNFRQRLGLEDAVFSIDVASTGFGASYHVEAVVPNELKIMKALLTDGRGKTAKCDQCDRASLYLRDDADSAYDHNDADAADDDDEDSKPPANGGKLTVLALTHRSVLLLPASAIAMISALALLVGGVVAWRHVLGDNVSGSAGSAVFLAPSIAAGLVLYRAEAPLVRVMLARLRLMLAFVAGLAFLGGGLFAFGLRDSALGISWMVLGAVAAVCAGILICAAVTAAGDETPPKMETGSDADQSKR